MKIDLHSHTKFSDGLLTVEELLFRAQQMQVDVLAITDHDCVDAIEPAQQFIQQHKLKLRLVSGVEISTKWHGFEIHILGLGLDHLCPTLLARLQTQLGKREARALKIDAKLEKIGIHGVLKEAQLSVPNRCISRAHLAHVLVKRGLVANHQQAFTQYLGAKKKAFVVPDWIGIDEAITWIHEAGGYAVIAHPFHYDMTTKWLRRLADEFKQYGGDGMEVQYPNLPLKKHQLMIEIANENGLLGSAGSDFHGPSKWTELGRRLNLPDSIKPIWDLVNK